MSNIDLDGALVSPSLGFKYYINYWYQGNSLGIEDGEIGQIQSAWSDKLPAWKHYVEDVAPDGTVYEIDESDYEAAMQAGEDYGKDLTGYGNSGWDKTKQITREVGTGVATGLHGFQVVKAGGLSALGQTGGKFLGVGGGQALTETAKQTGKESLKTVLGKAGGLLISCALDLAMAALYWFIRPNKEQYEAAMKVNEELGTQQGLLNDASNDITNYELAVMDLNDEAGQVVDDANQRMAEKKVEYDYNRDTIEYFKSDVTSGYRLTEGDVEAYKGALQHMNQAGAEIELTRAGASDQTNALFDKMSGYTEGFDAAAETMGEVQGFTDYAEGFDKRTQDCCKAEMAMQYLNMAIAAMDVARCLTKIALTMGWGMAVYGVCMAMSVTAGYMDYKAAIEQKTWADNIGNEIAGREMTQDLQTETKGLYDDTITNYDGLMMETAGLMLSVPEGTAPPEDTSIPTPSGSGNDDGDDGKNKKKNL